MNKIIAAALVAIVTIVSAEHRASAQPYTCTQTGPASISCNGNSNNFCTGSGDVGTNCPAGYFCRPVEGGTFPYCYSPDPCAGRCGVVDWAPGCSAPPLDDCNFQCPNTCPGNEVCVPQTVVGGEILNGTCCTPTTCAAHGAQCGPLADGCGGTISCGSCPSGQECNPQNLQCCTPTVTCSTHPGACGTIGDGCGGTIQCSCPVGQECNAGTCCTPTVTCAANACGSIAGGDGCGGTLKCGACPNNIPCVDSAHVCEACSPSTCAALGATCGTIRNGTCDNLLICGDCAAGSYCSNQTHQCVVGSTPAPASTLPSTMLLAGLLATAALVLGKRRQKR